MKRRRVFVRPFSVLASVILVFGLMLALPAEAAAPTFMTQLAKLLASDGAAHDWFGSDVAISGDTAVIGAPSHDVVRGGLRISAGAVYVFRRSGSGWILEDEVAASDAELGAQFGASVAIQGETMLVGAPMDDEPALFPGAAYVFTRASFGGHTWWAQRAKLTAGTDADDWDCLGSSVSLSNGTAFLGAPGKDVNSGAVYVFVGSGSTWALEKKITPSFGNDGDQFGYDLAASGDLLVVGSPYDNDRGADSGSFSAYVRAGGDWDFKGVYTAQSDAEADGEYGTSVAISGSTAVIGEPGGNNDEGAAYVYKWSAAGGGYWALQTRLTASDGGDFEEFGSAVGVSGDVAVVCAEHDGSGRGSAYFFTRTGTTWTEEKKVTASDGLPNDNLGASVALLNGTAVIGALYDDDKGTNSGSAYIFGTQDPVYRFYRAGVGTHFYTPNEAEKAYVIANLSNVYTYEGIAYSVNPENNNQPLHRFFNKKNGSHFYTASETEKASVIANLSAVYSYDGPTYKVSTAVAPGKPPVWRFFNKRNGSHFYTASEVEKNSVVANLSGTYTLEGVAFWLGQ